MRLRFNELPQPVRARLVGLFSNPSDPRVLQYAHEAHLGLFNWVFAIGALGGVGYTFAWLLQRGAQTSPRSDVEVYAGLAGLLWLLGVSVLGVVFGFAWKRPPWKDGTYVLRSALVSTNGGYLDVLPLHELGRPTIVNRYRNGVYKGSRLELKAHQSGGATYTFAFGSQAAASEACDRVLAAARTWSAVLDARDAQRVAADDVFAECTMSGSWTNPPGAPLGGPLVAAVPTSMQWVRWLGTAAFGVAVAGATFVAIDNLLEDERDTYNAERYGKKKPPSVHKSKKSAPVDDE